MGRWFLRVLLAFTVVCCSVYSQDKPAPATNSSSPDAQTTFTFRFGEGGFKDGRSPVGELGGDQLALDIRPAAHPFALSFSSEYYANSPDPSHPYEISDAFAVNLLYFDRLLDNDHLDYFLGGGIGRLKVPRGETANDAMVNGHFYNLEAGIHIKVYDHFGLYGLYKYFYARKTDNDVRLIDFNEHIILVGVTFTFRR